MAQKFNQKSKTEKNKVATKVFVWFMLASILGSGFLSVLYTLFSL